MNSVIQKLETWKYSKQEMHKGRPIGNKIILNKIIIWGGTIKPLPRFGLKVGEKKIEIEDLNEAELNWLSRELSDWLQVPIEQR